MWTEEGGRIQVHSTLQKRLQLVLDRDEPKADPAPGNELYQEVDVALRAMFPTSRRAKEGETSNAMPAAELRKLVAVNRFEDIIHWFAAIISGSRPHMVRASTAV